MELDLTTDEYLRHLILKAVSFLERNFSFFYWKKEIQNARTWNSEKRKLRPEIGQLVHSGSIEFVQVMSVDYSMQIIAVLFVVSKRRKYCGLLCWYRDNVTFCYGSLHFLQTGARCILTFRFPCRYQGYWICLQFSSDLLDTLPAQFKEIDHFCFIHFSVSNLEDELEYWHQMPRICNGHLLWVGLRTMIRSILSVTGNNRSDNDVNSQLNLTTS